MRDMPLLARDKVRFVGEPVAVVAADDPETAEEALELIVVEYQELPGVFDPEEALKPDAPRIHEDPASYDGAPGNRPDLSNLQSYVAWDHGDLEAGFKEADRVFEHTFSTPLTHHGYLEPHACTVWVHPGGQVEVWASNKGPYGLRDFLIKHLDAPAEEVKVHVMPVGGDFGGKQSLVDVPLCYLLSQQLHLPVKLVSTYAEELTAIPHRHPAVMTVKTGVKLDGTLCAMELRVLFSGGAYAAFKPNVQVTVQGARQAASCYRIPAIHVEDYCVYTNQVSCNQDRTPGGPQVVFAVESHLDIIARELGMDPAEFRMKNLIEEGEPTPLGQNWSQIRAKETLRKAMEASAWSEPKPSPRHGRGVAMFERSAGAGRSSAAISVDPQGAVTLVLTIPDTGPGAHTVMQQIVAETLGVPLDQVGVQVGDTDTLPFEAGVGGSKTTNSGGRAAYDAAQATVLALSEAAAAHWGCPVEQVQHVDGRFTGPGAQSVSFQEAVLLATGGGAEPLYRMSQFEPPEARTVTSFCAQVAEVEVDPETGQVRLQRLVTVHDVGTVLNPITHQGQVAGGIIQGMGFGLQEETPMIDGYVAAAHLGDFKLPTTRDVPVLETVLIKDAPGPTPYEGKAIGELPNVPTAAAIANAVYDAVGVRVYDLPITAEKVVRARKGGPPR
jgi:CO/xanthine dehydrogenase Mo-binding subunit